MATEEALAGKESVEQISSWCLSCGSPGLGRSRRTRPSEQVPSWPLAGGDGHCPTPAHSGDLPCTAIPAAVGEPPTPHIHRENQKVWTNQSHHIISECPEDAPGSVQAIPIPRGHRSPSQDPVWSSSAGVTCTGESCTDPPGPQTSHDHQHSSPAQVKPPSTWPPAQDRAPACQQRCLLHPEPLPTPNHPCRSGTAAPTCCCPCLRG